MCSPPTLAMPVGPRALSKRSDETALAVSRPDLSETRRARVHTNPVTRDRLQVHAPPKGPFKVMDV